VPNSKQQLYWRKHLQLIAILLAIWFVVAILVSIVFVQQINQLQLFGYYAIAANRLEKQYITEQDSE